VTIERHADVLRLAADELAKLADAKVGTTGDSISLRVASDLARAAARHIDAAAARDADPAMLRTAQRLARASAAASQGIQPA
jgi:hypothetical protein